MIDRRTMLLGLGGFVATADVAGAEARDEAYENNQQLGGGGFSPRGIPRRFRRQIVQDPTGAAPGTIVVDPNARYLYLVMRRGKAMRYGVGVGRQGFEWSGRAVIKRKAKWPRWTPTKDMIKREPRLAKWAKGMEGGVRNPLGARALYLYEGGVDTLYRIHGTNEPWSIGRAMSSGCIRLLNKDIVDLFNRVTLGTRVIVRS